MNKQLRLLKKLDALSDAADVKSFKREISTLHKKFVSLEKEIQKKYSGFDPWAIAGDDKSMPDNKSILEERIVEDGAIEKGDAKKYAVKISKLMNEFWVILENYDEAGVINAGEQDQVLVKGTDNWISIVGGWPTNTLVKKLK